MKNVSMTINNNAIQSLAPPPMPQGFPVAPPLIQEYSVSFSVRFDNEDGAIAFGKFILNNIEVFRNGDR